MLVPTVLLKQRNVNANLKQKSSLLSSDCSSVSSVKRRHKVSTAMKKFPAIGCPDFLDQTVGSFDAITYQNGSVAGQKSTTEDKKKVNNGQVRLFN